MDDKRRRSRNRKTGLLVLAGMIGLAALTAGYAYYTIGFRREVDKLQPEARPFRSDLLTVAVIATAVVALALIIWRIIGPKPDDSQT